MHLPLLLLLLLAATPLAAAPSEALLDAICHVESGGDCNAVGDQGRSVGPYQIMSGVVSDVNRVYGTNYTLDDRRDPAKAREICRLYLSHYGDRAGGTPEAYARVWNGGPRGHRKAATVAYWQRVQAVLSRQA